MYKYRQELKHMEKGVSLQSLSINNLGLEDNHTWTCGKHKNCRIHDIVVMNQVIKIFSDEYRPFQDSCSSAIILYPVTSWPNVFPCSQILE